MRALAWILLLTACAPEIPDATFVCTTTADCPPDQRCASGLCRRGGACTPLACDVECGQAPDGCGGTLDCGTCAAPAMCASGRCCTPQQCDGRCGRLSDGCGGTLDCPGCTPPETCGGGGPNLCGIGTCTPATCAEGQCGSVPDGCGDLLECGGCAAPEVCGATAPNRCGCVRDPYEDNDSAEAAFGMDLLMVETPQMVEDATIDAAGDEDWFFWPIMPGAFDTHYGAEIWLRSIPMGSNYDLQVEFLCGSAPCMVTCSSTMSVGTSCRSQMGGQMNERVAIERSPVTGLTGLRVRVVPVEVGDCAAPYALSVLLSRLAP